MEEILKLIESLEYKIEDSNASTYQINMMIDDIDKLKTLLKTL